MTGASPVVQLPFDQPLQQLSNETAGPSPHPVAPFAPVRVPFRQRDRLIDAAARRSRPFQKDFFAGAVPAPTVGNPRYLDTVRDLESARGRIGPLEETSHDREGRVRACELEAAAVVVPHPDPDDQGW